VTATINGTNDAPSFSGTGSVSVFTENGAAVRVAGTGTVQSPVTVTASDVLFGPLAPTATVLASTRTYLVTAAGRVYDVTATARTYTVEAQQV